MADNIYAINKANCIFHDIKDASNEDIRKAFKMLALDDCLYLLKIINIAAEVFMETKDDK